MIAWIMNSLFFIFFFSFLACVFSLLSVLVFSFVLFLSSLFSLLSTFFSSLASPLFLHSPFYIIFSLCFLVFSFFSLLPILVSRSISKCKKKYLQKKQASPKNGGQKCHQKVGLRKWGRITYQFKIHTRINFIIHTKT